MPEVAPKNQTDDIFDPDYMHRITFGNPPRNSLPAQLVDAGEVEDLMAVRGRFESLKRTIEISNADMYRYLRIGVSTQSASHLKWMGYDTPESLTESPKVAALLPDHLARNGGEYPLAFINKCEEEGVSAVVCQMAIRRGLTEYHHMHGVLDLRQLLYAFTHFVKKNVTLTNESDKQPSLINYICDGTLPYEFVKGYDTHTQSLIALAREVLVPEPESELAQRALSDEKVFKRLVRVIGGSNNSVASIRKVIDEYGYDALNLSVPTLCLAEVGEGKDIHPLGLESAQFVEDFSKASGNSRYAEDLYYYGYNSQLNFHANGSWADSVRVSFTDLDELRRSGIEPGVAYRYVVDQKVPVGSLIAAKEDGVETVLMSGAL